MSLTQTHIRFHRGGNDDRTRDQKPTRRSSPGPLQGHWRLADWEALPDDGNRYEIIDGVLYMTTTPHSFHQWIIRRLERFIGIPAEDAGLAYCFPAPVGVIMPGCDPVQPDYVVVLQSRTDLFRNGRIYGVPDLIIEVLSPGDARV
jgi:Uma2 family endonuclease